MTLERYQVGDAVIITPDCIKRMRSSNRSSATPQYPVDKFINAMEKFVGVQGKITRTFPFSYEANATFNGRTFHVKHHWVEKCTK